MLACVYFPHPKMTKKNFNVLITWRLKTLFRIRRFNTCPTKTNDFMENCIVMSVSQVDRRKMKKKKSIVIV